MPRKSPQHKRYVPIIIAARISYLSKRYKGRAVKKSYRDPQDIVDNFRGEAMLTCIQPSCSGGFSVALR
jgi:hypothetical protein